MNYHHLFIAGLLALGFSGMPAPERTATALPAAKYRLLSDTTNSREADEYISWSPSKLLTWEDFQCTPHRGTDAVASTSTSLGIAYQVVNGELTYHITCNFSKQKSWGLMKTDYILAHEQGHFDITELFARRLHEALSQYQFDRHSFKKDITEIYNHIVEEKETMQHQYDRESDHSRNRGVQYDWLEKIRTELDGTDLWASYP